MANARGQNKKLAPRTFRQQRTAAPQNVSGVRNAGGHHGNALPRMRNQLEFFAVRRRARRLRLFRGRNPGHQRIANSKHFDVRGQPGVVARKRFRTKSFLRNRWRSALSSWRFLSPGDFLRTPVVSPGDRGVSARQHSAYCFQHVGAVGCRAGNRKSLRLSALSFSVHRHGNCRLPAQCISRKFLCWRQRRATRHDRRDDRYHHQTRRRNHESRKIAPHLVGGDHFCDGRLSRNARR